MRHPMELSVSEYRSQIERQRELKLGALPASLQQQQQQQQQEEEAAGVGAGPGRGSGSVAGTGGSGGVGHLVMLGDSGEASATEATAERRRQVVHADLLQGGACKRIAAAVSPEAGATPIILSAAAAAIAALALIADYANDQALLEALAPMEDALQRVEQVMGGNVVTMQDVMDAAANPAYRRLLPEERDDHAAVFREAIQELRAFGRKVEFHMRHAAGVVQVHAR